MKNCKFQVKENGVVLAEMIKDVEPYMGSLDRALKFQAVNFAKQHNHDYCVVYSCENITGKEMKCYEANKNFNGTWSGHFCAIQSLLA